MTKLLKYGEKFNKLADKAMRDGIDVIIFFEQKDRKMAGQCVNSTRRGVERALEAIQNLLNEKREKNE